MQALIESMSYLRTPGKSLIATYICGTPGKIVGLWRRMVFSMSATSKRAFTISVAPRDTGTFRAVVNP